MLSITRSLARDLRATFKKAVDVEFRNKPTSLAIRDTALETTGPFGPVGIENVAD